MRWFRLHIRLGSRLALFALAVQIVLSFAHVHLADVAQAPSRMSIVAAGSSAAPGIPPHKSNGIVDPGCAVCALIQLAATSAPSTAPTLRLPAMLGQGRPDASVAVTLAALPHSLFQARAPPSI
jgi:hypothetical protein